jgi:hypothetical protein
LFEEPLSSIKNREFLDHLKEFQIPKIDCPAGCQSNVPEFAKVHRKQLKILTFLTMKENKSINIREVSCTQPKIALKSLLRYPDDRPASSSEISVHYC